MNNKRPYILLALLLGFVYRLLLGLQGIDTSDSGFSNTFFQNIFAHPEAMPFSFNYYLTGFVGGLWHALLGQWGIVGFRVLEAMTITAAIALLYKAFQPWLSGTRTATAAILLAFLLPTVVPTFHYNTLSYLFMSLATYCFSRYVRTERAFWTFLAGAAIGICFFARIVNLTLGILLLVPLLFRKTRATLAMALGMLAGVLTVVGLMAALGHLTYFQQALAEAFGFFSTNETTHSSGNLFAVYFKSYVNIGLQMAALFALYKLYTWPSQSWSLLLKGVAAAAFIALGLTSQPYLLCIALCTLLCLTGIPNGVLKSTEGMVILFAGTCVYTFPFGSDIGIPGIFHWASGLLILPAACCSRFLRQPLQRQALTVAYTIMAAILLVKAIGYAYGEDQLRIYDTERIDAQRLNALTEPQRAARFRHVIEAIRTHAQDNPWLIFGNQAAELYYATGKLPITGNTQSEQFMGNTLKRQLDQRCEEFQCRPVVVFLKTDHDSWSDPEQQQTLREWMRDKTYTTVLDDSILTIFLPASPTMGSHPAGTAAQFSTNQSAIQYKPTANSGRITAQFNANHNSLNIRQLYKTQIKSRTL